MQNQFTIFRRGHVFYCEDRTTRQQRNLQTRDAAEAHRIVQARNDAVKLPQMNLVMARTYLSAQDPKMITRTWADVLVRFCDRSNANTRMAGIPQCWAQAALGHDSKAVHDAYARNALVVCPPIDEINRWNAPDHHAGAGY